MAQWAVATGKEREGESSSMGKAAAATQPELPGSQTQGNGDRDMLAQSPTAAVKRRWQWWCQTPGERKHQQCFMRHKRYCGKKLNPQMWTNDPCRAEFHRCHGGFWGTKEFWDGDAEG